MLFPNSNNKCHNANRKNVEPGWNLGPQLIRRSYFGILFHQSSDGIFLKKKICRHSVDSEIC